MEDIKKRFLLYGLQIVALGILSLICMIATGDYPIFLIWGTLELFAIVAAIAIVQSKEEFILFIFGITLLAALEFLFYKCCASFLGDHSLLSFIASLYLLSPLYLVLIVYLKKRCENLLMELMEEAENVRIQ